jgi:flagellar biosynthetic protein FlhB
MAEQKPGGEPTEQPTPKRLADARRKGQVARSQDLSGCLVFWSGLGVLLITTESLAGRLMTMVRQCCSATARPSREVVMGQLGASLTGTLTMLAPLLGAVALGAVVAGAAQTQGLFTPQPLKPKLSNLNPLKGMGRLFGKESLFRLLKTLMLFLAAFLIAFLTLRQHLPDVMRTLGSAPSGFGVVTLSVAKTLAIRIGLCFVAVAAADYAFQYHRHRKQLMMTRYEVEKETKESEGDPQHKARRKELHQEISNQAMLHAVEEADFVVCNPTRLAVAMRYSAEKDEAPIVVAKGQMLMAKRIKERARRAGVPIFHDVSLARALYELEVEEEIPEQLYDAVAGVLRVLMQSEEGKEAEGR